MGQRDDDFTQVLVRLQAVRDELTGTRSPERVAVLRDVASELVAQGRELLGRHLDRPGEAPSATSPTERDATRGSDAPASGEPTSGATQVLVRPTSPQEARGDEPPADEAATAAAAAPTGPEAAVPPQESGTERRAPGRPASR